MKISIVICISNLVSKSTVMKTIDLKDHKTDQQQKYSNYKKVIHGMVKKKKIRKQRRNRNYTNNRKQNKEKKTKAKTNQ